MKIDQAILRKKHCAASMNAKLKLVNEVAE
jgi:hypothetical protein